MSSGAFSIDQLMELAGLAVSQVGRSTPSSLAASWLKCLCSSPSAPPEQGRQDPRCLRPGKQWSVRWVRWHLRNAARLGGFGSRKITGGDGLVAARHLHQFGYHPSVFYPKRSKNELYQVGRCCGRRSVASTRDVAKHLGFVAMKLRSLVQFCLVSIPAIVPAHLEPSICSRRQPCYRHLLTFPLFVANAWLE